MIKVDELLDLINEENLICKDNNQAKYLKSLERADCKNIASN